MCYKSLLGNRKKEGGAPRSANQIPEEAGHTQAADHS